MFGEVVNQGWGENFPFQAYFTWPNSPRQQLNHMIIVTNDCEQTVNDCDSSRNDQLPVGLLAQLVKHCTGIAELMGSNPKIAFIFI